MPILPNWVISRKGRAEEELAPAIRLALLLDAAGQSEQFVIMYGLPAPVLFTLPGTKISRLDADFWQQTQRQLLL